MTVTLELFSYMLIFLFGMITGRFCRKYREMPTIRYPLMEAANGVWYVLVFVSYGFQMESIFFCLMGSALLVLSVIDFYTYEIPAVFSIFIAALGTMRVVFDMQSWHVYAGGAVLVSSFLFLIYLATGGRAIGGGDVKLMAACGLLAGWKLVFLAFLLGCVLGSVFHLIRMRKANVGHVLAMGPYLSAGMMIAVLWGNDCINWYLTTFG